MHDYVPLNFVPHVPTPGMYVRPLYVHLHLFIRRQGRIGTFPSFTGFGMSMGNFRFWHNWLLICIPVHQYIRHAGNQ